MRICATIVVLLAGLCTVAAAAEPAPVAPPDPLPVPYFSGPPVVRINRYAVWQNYAVDRRGYFRPRVILTQEGDAFYTIDARPYPWLHVRTLDFMPYASE